MPTIDISDEAMLYLKGLAEPFVDTPASVLDRIIAEHKSVSRSIAKQDTPVNKVPIFKTSNLPELLHTKVQSASICGHQLARPNWKTIVVSMIEYAAMNGKSPSEIRNALKAFSCDGERTDTGFEYVKSAGISFQGLDANRSCEAALGLAAAFNIPVSIDFFWRDKEKALNPGQSGRIEFP